MSYTGKYSEIKLVELILEQVKELNLLIKEAYDANIRVDIDPDIVSEVGKDFYRPYVRVKVFKFLGRGD